MERYIGHKNGYVILLFSVCIVLTYLYYYVILDKRFSLPFWSSDPIRPIMLWSSPGNSWETPSLGRALLKKLESSMSQEPGVMGDKKRTGCDGIRGNGAASSHRCSCCRQEKRTVISPFQPQRDSRATRERYTRAMCSVLNPEAELMESPFMMQRGEFGVHSLS